METQQRRLPQTGVGSGGVSKSGAKGRKDADKQEAVIKMESLVTNVDHLTVLYREMETAKVDFAEGVKAVAEAAGLHAKNVRSYIIARAGDRFDDKKAQICQLSLIFEEAEA